MRFPTLRIAALCALALLSVQPIPLPAQAIAAAHPRAVEAGMAIMERGGNAVDAAVATAFTLAVVEPNASGLGGGGGALVRMADDEAATVVSYRITAPALADYSTVDFSRSSAWGNTGLAACTPGFVHGLLAMHGRWGALSREAVLAPAIDVAENGFEAGETLCMLIGDLYEKILADDALAAIYLPDMFPPEPGQRLRNPDLAAVLRLIAERGVEGFAAGPVAASIEAGLSAKGGLVREGDLAGFEPVFGEPVVDTYRGHTLETSGPPFASFAVLEMLSLVEPFDVRAMGYPSVESVALFTEAMWIASRDYRLNLGDDRFVEVDTAQFLTDGYAAEQREHLAAALARAVELTPAPAGAAGEPGSTTHLSVVDAHGNAVSMTNTLGAFFGCGVAAPGTGIVFNNQMRNFTTRPGRVNSLAPGKSPRSSQSPTIVTRDGELIGAVGSPGNFRIVTTVPLVLSLIIDFGLPLEEALDAPRIAIRQRSSRPDGRDPLNLEGGIDPAIAQTMRAMGYEIREHETHDIYFGGVHVVWRDPQTGRFVAAADPRRDGVAVSEEE